MSAIRHLRQCAFKSVLRDSEKEKIKRSARTVIINLRKYFKKDIKKIQIFGSFSRGTLLPRKIDERSDIDILVVFSERDAIPQTYLNRVRRFVETNYSRSEIYQSHPTIVLSLNHINIEIVPAVNSLFSGLQIPAPASNYEEWIDTSPTEFNAELQDKNKSAGSNIKPLIRLAKYWNAKQGYIYPSYELEQRLVSHWYFGAKNIRDYFYQGVSALDLSWSAAQWKNDKLESAKELIQSAKEAERLGKNDWAELEMKKLLPVFW